MRAGESGRGLFNSDRCAAVPADPQFRRDVLDGLSAARRRLPSRWFYDRTGSELFEAITELPEYYPTRTEVGILQAAAIEIATLIGRGRSVVEFGAGSAMKTPILLGAAEPSVYVPIDISGEFLEVSVEALKQQFPDLSVRAVAGDFTRPLVLPDEIRRRPRLGFFPGSTIGNFDPAEAVDLLRSMARTLGPDSMLLIGLDRVKDPSIAIPAYDDAAGVTAAFNLNILHRINRELDGAIPTEAFEHLALWDPERRRIEMHLEASRDVDFSIDGCRFSMRSGERIHTESSHKYALEEAKLLLRAGGWEPVTHWTDQNAWFSVLLAREPSSASV